MQAARWRMHACTPVSIRTRGCAHGWMGVCMCVLVLGVGRASDGMRPGMMQAGDSVCGARVQGPPGLCRHMHIQLMPGMMSPGLLPRRTQRCATCARTTAVHMPSMPACHARRPAGCVPGVDGAALPRRPLDTAAHRACRRRPPTQPPQVRTHTPSHAMLRMHVCTRHRRYNTTHGQRVSALHPHQSSGAVGAWPTDHRPGGVKCRGFKRGTHSWR